MSHGMVNAFDISGTLLASNGAATTLSTRSLPLICTTDVDKYNGMSKSCRHCTTFLVNPAEYGMISTTAFTSIPLQRKRRAIIRPISPEPTITADLPGSLPLQLSNFCAAPAVKIPAGLPPGVAIAPLVRSRHPAASKRALAFMCFTPNFFDVTRKSKVPSASFFTLVTAESSAKDTPALRAFSDIRKANSGPVSSSLK